MTTCALCGKEHQSPTSSVFILCDEHLLYAAQQGISAEDIFNGICKEFIDDENEHWINMNYRQSAQIDSFVASELQRIAATS